jgi:hypothetical protein
MNVTVEQSVEWRLAGETEVLEENLPQRHWSLLCHAHFCSLFTTFYYPNVSTSHLKTVFNFAYRMKSFLCPHNSSTYWHSTNSVCTVSFTKLMVQSYYKTVFYVHNICSPMNCSLICGSDFWSMTCFLWACSVLSPPPLSFPSIMSGLPNHPSLSISRVVCLGLRLYWNILFWFLKSC